MPKPNAKTSSARQRTRTNAHALALSMMEAASLANIGLSTLYRLVHDGQVRTVKLGKRRLVPRVEIERLFG